nr:HD domain-containing protein [Trichocoleus sp. FACHB-90]
MISERFTEALTFTTRLHANQTRKGSGVPYIAHLLGVASIVLEHGGNEEEAIAYKNAPADVDSSFFPNTNPIGFGNFLR